VREFFDQLDSRLRGNDEFSLYWTIWVNLKIEFGEGVVNVLQSSGQPNAAGFSKNCFIE